METAILMAGVAMLGNYLNPQKQSRGPVVPTDSTVAPNDIPSDQRVVDKFSAVSSANDFVQRKADRKFRLLNPVPLTGGIAPDDGKSGYPADLSVLNMTLEKTSRLGADIVYPQQKEGAPVNMFAVDPQTGKKVQSSFDKIYGGDMFRSGNFKGIDDFIKSPNGDDQVVEAFMPVDSNVSLLSGTSIDMKHANMVPAFRPGAHRATGNEELKSSRLEMFTGIASDYSTWIPKQEVAKELNPGRAIKPAAITELRDTEKRVIDSLGSNRSRDNFKTPTKPIAVLPMNTDLIQIKPKTFNELYPSKAIQESTGRATGGKFITGESANVSALGFRRDPLPVEGRDVVGNRSVVTGNALMVSPQLRDVSRASETKNMYMGIASSGVKRYDTEMGANAFSGTDTVQRRNDIVTLPMMAPDVQRSRRAMDSEFLMRDPEKGIAETYMRPADSAKGFRERKGVVAPSVTLKDLVDTSELAGKHGYKSSQQSGMYSELDVTAPMTLKAVNSETTYTAPMFKNKGFGVRQHGIQDWQTLKQGLAKEHYGPAKSAVNRIMSYDAAVTSITDRSLQMDYQRARGNIREVGINRDTTIELKDHLTTEVQNHGVQSSYEPFYTDASVELRDEIMKDPERVFPNGREIDTTYADVGQSEKTLVSYEAENDRLDSSIVVPNTDLYPHLAK